jgi:hypothetical protein
MKKNLLILFIICQFQTQYAQQDSAFQIGVFSEYRITPIYTQGAQGYVIGTLQDVYYSAHKHLTGGRIGVQFRLAFTKKKKISLGFSHIIGYDHLLYESLDGNRYSQNSGEMISKKTLLSDFIFYF